MIRSPFERKTPEGAQLLQLSSSRDQRTFRTTTSILVIVAPGPPDCDQHARLKHRTKTVTSTATGPWRAGARTPSLLGSIERSRSLHSPDPALPKRPIDPQTASGSRRPRAKGTHLRRLLHTPRSAGVRRAR